MNSVNYNLFKRILGKFSRKNLKRRITCTSIILFQLLNVHASRLSVDEQGIFLHQKTENFAYYTVFCYSEDGDWSRSEMSEFLGTGEEKRIWLGKQTTGESTLFQVIWGRSISIEDERNHPPIYSLTYAPKYPDALWEAGIEGQVSAIFVVSRNGEVKDIEIEYSDHHLFTESVLEALENWQFLPAKKNGITVAVRVRQPIPFSIGSYPPDVLK